MAPKSKQKASKSRSSVASSQTPQANEDKPPSLNWPPLTPLIPIPDLTLTTLLTDQILLIPNFLTSTLCKSYTTFLSTLPLITTANKPKHGNAVRVNDRFQTHDPTFAHNLWTGTSLQDLVTNHPNPGIWGGEILGLNPNIRVYRYRAGQFFDKHYDESNRLNFGQLPAGGGGGGGGGVAAAKTTWTLLIYLSRCEGGETVFYPEGVVRKGPVLEPVVVGVEVGLALLHRHGEECLLHEGRKGEVGVED